MNGSLNLLEKALGLDDSLEFEHFVRSADYLGLDSVYDFWFDEFGRVKDDVSELIIDGSLGGGKSFLVAIYLTYRITKLFMQGDPCLVLGLSPGSEIYVLYFSVSQTTAKATGYKYIFNMVDRCKWLTNNYPRNKNVTSEIQFPNHFTIMHASAEGHQIGMNVWGFILDEANFRGGVGKGTQDQYAETFRLCSQLIDRQITRFSTPTGINALACFVSSAAYESSFIETRKELARKDPNAIIITAVQYKINPQNYSKEMFEVFCGYGQAEPRIVESAKEKEGLLSSAEISPDLAYKYFEKVPVSIKKQFEINIYLAIQNHCGRPTNVKGTFMTNITVLNGAYEKEILNAFFQDKVTISSADDSELSEFFDLERVKYPDRPHSIFLDLSIQGDSGGFSCTRYDGIEEGVRQHVHVFTVEIVPPQFPAMTRIQKIFTFVVWLVENGVNVTAFGSDQYQSTQIRQDINAELGLTDIRLSIDSSDIPHLHWMQTLIEKRFWMIFVERLDKEIKEAEHDTRRRRVLKRDKSSDDLFQSLVGSVYLSDTISATYADDLTDLYPERMNLVGGKSISHVLKTLGYKS